MLIYFVVTRITRKFVYSRAATRHLADKPADVQVDIQTDVPADIRREEPADITHSPLSHYLPLSPSHSPPLPFSSHRNPLLPFPFPSHPLSIHSLSLYSLSRTLSLSISFPLTLSPSSLSPHLFRPLSSFSVFLPQPLYHTVSVLQRNLYVCLKRLPAHWSTDRPLCSTDRPLWSTGRPLWVTY